MKRIYDRERPNARAMNFAAAVSNTDTNAAITEQPIKQNAEEINCIKPHNSKNTTEASTNATLFETPNKFTVLTPYDDMADIEIYQNSLKTKRGITSPQEGPAH